VEPFAVRAGLIRQFKTSDYRPSPQPARERRALVVGAPKLSKPTALPDLPGAREEALRVAEVLSRNGYKGWGGESVVALTDAEPLDIVGKLFSREYKILHLAGHGLYNKENPDESGMVLDEGMYLSSKELCNLNPIPELVFINCCHLGKLDDKEVPARVDWSPHRLAASISEELIKMGVKAVVAAGWAVNDRVAVTFAETFYRQMLAGEKFGRAVHEARVAARAFAPQSNTWGAYQCYGNPDFVLETVGGAGQGAREAPERPLSKRELLQTLIDVPADATRADGEGTKALRSRLKQLREGLPPEWLDGEVLNAFGVAWGELRDYERAAEFYQEAMNYEDAAAPVRAVEQYVSMLLKRSDELRTAAPAAKPAAGGEGVAPPDPGELIETAVALLDWLGKKLKPTSERLSLAGGCYKRKATAAADAGERRALLETAMEYYRDAHELNAQENRLDTYPTLNWLTYKVLLGAPLDAADRKLVEKCREAGTKAKKKGRPTFWNRVAVPDAELLVHLDAGDLGAHLDKISKDYKSAFDAGSTHRERSTVLEHLDFLTGMLEAAEAAGLGARQAGKGAAKKGSKKTAKKGARKGAGASPGVSALRKLREALAPRE
jgi:tetratricopeptide (TPR) repeat protein